MPTRTAFAQLSFPIHLTVFRGPGLPQGEIAHIIFGIFVAINASTRSTLEGLGIQTGQFSIGGKSIDTVVNRAIYRIGVATFLELLNECYHLRDVVGSRWVDLGRFDVQCS